MSWVQWVPWEFVTCKRCPQVFKHWYGKRIQPLCEDCRYVASAAERAIYEAS